jgi:hypothetical protein
MASGVLPLPEAMMIRMTRREIAIAALRSVTGLLSVIGARALAQEVPVASTADPESDTVELHRIRIVNAKNGPIQISTDEGASWRIIGRVTSPCISATEGYIAAEYAEPGSVAAVAIHGLRIRIGGENKTLHAPLVLAIDPREFSSDNVPNHGFGGHVSGLSGMKTDIPAGASLFRNLAPITGNTVYTEMRSGRLQKLGTAFRPAGNGEALVIPVRVPKKRLTELVIENKKGGAVTATFSDAEVRKLTSVVQPVSGVGRFDGTAYTGVGRINTAHTGVITVSTAPIDASEREGQGKERRGGFQISPLWHNTRTEEHGAPMMLVLGSFSIDGVPQKKRELEGTAPLFRDQISLFGEGVIVDCQIDGKSEWEPLPAILGVRLDAFTGEGLTQVFKDAGISRRCELGVTAFRLRLPHTTRTDSERLALIAAGFYRRERLAVARSVKTPIVSGSVTINPSVTDASRVAFVRFSVDGTIKSIKNYAPFDMTWDTTRFPDGEYFLEIEALDSTSVVLASTHRRVYVLNNKAVAEVR